MKWIQVSEFKLIPINRTVCSLDFHHDLFVTVNKTTPSLGVNHATWSSIFPFVWNSELHSSLSWFNLQGGKNSSRESSVHTQYSVAPFQFVQWLNTDRTAVVTVRHCQCVYCGNRPQGPEVCFSLLLVLSSTALMAGPVGWLPAICPGIVLCMPLTHTSVESDWISVCLCSSSSSIISINSNIEYIIPVCI